MAKRKSIYIEGFGHKNPIPAACRLGNIVTSGIIYGLDVATGKPASMLDQQCVLMFKHLRSIVEAAGGTTDDIVKLNLWMVDRSQREAVNREWLKMFPDPDARPARQTMQAELGAGILVQCDFIAVIGGSSA
ncbi:MAG: RidA family protein [Hyphomicrobiaceae bacterium]|nr:MAG: RidA family protein [Hyphomicrobiaceae bacterium]